MSKLHNDETPRQRFDTAIRALLDSENPDVRSVFVYIQRLLFQFRLSQSYQAKDIIVEVYARGIKRIEMGEDIQIPLAWVRRAIYNVIRELRREFDRVKDYDLNLIPSPEQDLLSSMMLCDDLKALRIALKLLNSDEQILLNLRVVEGLAWRDVGKALVLAGDSEQTEGRLRQRGYRALTKLRNLYERVRCEICTEFDSEEEDES